MGTGDRASGINLSESNHTTHWGNAVWKEGHSTTEEKEERKHKERAREREIEDNITNASKH